MSNMCEACRGRQEPPAFTCMRGYGRPSVRRGSLTELSGTFSSLNCEEGKSVTIRSKTVTLRGGVRGRCICRNVKNECVFTAGRSNLSETLSESTYFYPQGRLRDPCCMSQLSSASRTGAPSKLIQDQGCRQRTDLLSYQPRSSTVWYVTWRASG